MQKDSLVRILEAGGHVRISSMSKETLIELARVAKRSKVRLEIVGSLNVDSLVEIAHAGGGAVLFDLSDG